MTTSDSQSNHPVNDQPTDQNRPTVFVKAKRYAGLFAVIALTVLLLAPSDRTDFPIRGSYIASTNLSHLVGQNWRAKFVKMPTEYQRACKQAEVRAKSPYSARQDMQSAINTCDPIHFLFLHGPAQEHALYVDSNYWDYIDEYSELAKVAREKQGIGQYDSPRPTPAMIAVVKKLTTIVDDMIPKARSWLVNMNLFAHLALAVFTFLGVRFREGVGAVLLAPIGWIFSIGKGSVEIAKEVHKKV